MASPKLSIFLPAYNEEEILEENCGRVLDALELLGMEFELVIVDDTSTDRTPEIAASLAERFDRVEFVRYENGPSRRENLADALRRARGGIVAFMDADLATDLEALPRLVGAVEGGADIATGDRYHPESVIRRTAYRFAVSRMANALVRAIFGSNIRDHFCGFKAFRADRLWPLLDQVGYDRAFMRGVLWDAELLLVAQRWGYRIEAIPIRWTEAPKTALRVRREARLIPYLFKLWRRMHRLETKGARDA